MPTKYEQIAYGLLEDPQFYLDIYRVQVLRKLSYADASKVMEVMQDKRFLDKAEEFYKSFKYPSRLQHTALENIKQLKEPLRHLKRVPQVHLYASPARKMMDELERDWKMDPDEFYRKLKQVKDAIKERERGKIIKFPELSLTELRQIVREANQLYR